MSYANRLEELQRLRAEVRRLEQLAEREAKSMRPLTLDDEKAMASIASPGGRCVPGCGASSSSASRSRETFGIPSTPGR
jgi:hypothetical protein